MNEEQTEYWGVPLKSFCMLIHLSQLTSIVVPGLGLILPIVMWVAHKDKSTDIDQHGKVTVNWIISFIIYGAVFTVLALLLIGFLGLFVLAIANFVFAIVAAIKANDGELWVYPLSIRFLK